MPRVTGLLFDKDGTLFDFQATWGAWTDALIADLTADAGPETAHALAAGLGFDRAAQRFLKSSPVIAGSHGETLAIFERHLPHIPLAALVARIDAAVQVVPQVEAAPLREFTAGLSASGHVLGVATNDSEASARAHLSKAGIEGAFAYIAGFDSGHGAKPGPGMVTAFLDQTGLAPDSVAMIGDSRHDLEAARAAGVRAIAVLTGPAEREDLAPHADAVLSSIAALPAWLNGAEAT